MIQATVVESSGRQVLLEMGQQQFKAQSDVEMHNGQKLNLEVVATEPRLKLQVVSPSTDNQLLRLIHLYDHKTEIGSTLKTLLGQRFSASQSAGQSPVSQQGPVTTSTPVAASASGQNISTATPTTLSPATVQQGAGSEATPGSVATNETIQAPPTVKSEVPQTNPNPSAAGGAENAKVPVQPTATAASSISPERAAASASGQEHLYSPPQQRYPLQRCSREQVLRQH